MENVKLIWYKRWILVWRGLDQILLKLGAMENRIMATLEDVQAAEAAQVTAVDTAVRLLQELKAKLDAAGTDPVKLDAIKASIDDATAKLNQAVLDNQPAV